jgi:hypothetical protein
LRGYLNHPVAGELVHRAVVALNTSFARPTNWAMISRNRSEPTAAAMSIEWTTSANKTVTCLYSAGRVVCVSFVPHDPQNSPVAVSPPPPSRLGSTAASFHRWSTTGAAHQWSQAKLKTQGGFFRRLHWPAGSASRLAFSQLAILVRSAVPSSNFPESGHAARATAT